MKKNFGIVIVCIICTMILAGCNENKTAESEEGKTKPETLEIESEKQETDEQKNNEVTDSVIDNEEPKDSGNTLKTITIYLPNENADGFVTETQQTSELSDDWIMEQLMNKDVVPGDVKVLSCTQTTEEDTPCLILDLNQAFSSYLQSMGTAGEYMVLGSVCNTYLDAYDCKQIQITVEGNVLETGHSDYPGYMTKFE